MVVLVTSAVLTRCGGGSSNSGGTGNPATGSAGDGQLDIVIEAIRQRYSVPALAAIMARNGVTIEKNAMGYRSDATNTDVTVNDRWQLGSITKSMTSLLTALLVRDSLI